MGQYTHEVLLRGYAGLLEWQVERVTDGQDKPPCWWTWQLRRQVRDEVYEDVADGVSWSSADEAERCAVAVLRSLQGSEVLPIEDLVREHARRTITAVRAKLALGAPTSPEQRKLAGLELLGRENWLILAAGAEDAFEGEISDPHLWLLAHAASAVLMDLLGVTP